MKLAKKSEVESEEANSECETAVASDSGDSQKDSEKL